MKTPLYEEVLPPGGMWSMMVRRGRTVSLTALGPGANVSALLYRADQPLDRLNLPDTLKALHTAKIARGHVLMSDMGHAMASVVGDTLGWHDPLGGHIDADGVREKFGTKSYQHHLNGFHRNAADNFLVELAKHGLGFRDVVANLNFFSKVTVDGDGRMSLAEGHCPEGASVVLRTEMDLLIVLANCPHPMASVGDYPSVPVCIEMRIAAAPGGDDECRCFRPECSRAMALTERLYL